MTYMAEQETPTDYDFWCAIWLMSCAVGRRAVVARPRAPVYMNPYIILVANSGVTRKSSAVNTARKIAQELLEDDATLGMLEAKVTPEKLDAILSERTRITGSSGLCIAVSELAIFLGTERYNAAMPASLTDLYDCSTSRSGGGTVSRGDTTQSNLFVNFVSASTPAWLHRSVNPNVVEGGFTSRCLFIVSEQPKRRIAWADADIRTDTSELLRSLRLIRTHSSNYGQITINDNGLAAFRSWYSRRTYNLDPFRSSFESREDAHILRVAAFLCINDDTWVIQATHIKSAIRLIASVKFGASKLFEGTQSTTHWILGLERLREVLLHAGQEPVARSALYLKVRQYLDNTEFHALIDVMHEMGVVQKFVRSHDGAGRPGELIRGTTLLNVKGTNEKILASIGC